MNDDTKVLDKVMSIDDKRIKNHVVGLVRDSAKETLKSLLDAEANAMCGAQRYEHSADWLDTRAGSYERQLHSTQTFETAIIAH